MKKIENQVEYMPVKDLTVYIDNPRTIKKDDFERLVQSIKDNPDYFEARPLIVSDRTGDNIVIAGNQRLRAALKIGLAEVPVVVLHGLTKEREDEIIIRDNVNNGDWDMDKLANEWDSEKLMDWGLFDVRKGISDEKEIEDKPPTIISSFVTFDYEDEIQLEISDETATSLMAEMIAYKNEHGSYNGFWDERLAK